jgi:hypothetical protein
MTQPATNLRDTIRTELVKDHTGWLTGHIDRHNPEQLERLVTEWTRAATAADLDEHGLRAALAHGIYDPDQLGEWAGGTAAQ